MVPPGAPPRVRRSTRAGLDLLSRPARLEREEERPQIRHRLLRPDAEVAQGFLTCLRELPARAAPAAAAASPPAPRGHRAVAVHGRGRLCGRRRAGSSPTWRSRSRSARRSSSAGPDPFRIRDERAQFSTRALRPRRRGALGVAAAHTAPAAAAQRFASPQLVLAGETVEHVRPVARAREAPLLELARMRCSRSATPRRRPRARAPAPPRRRGSPVVVSGDLRASRSSSPSAEATYRGGVVLLEQPADTSSSASTAASEAAGPTKPGSPPRPSSSPTACARIPLAGPRSPVMAFNPGRELELGVADQNRVLDAEPPEHRGRWSTLGRAHRRARTASPEPPSRRRPVQAENVTPGSDAVGSAGQQAAARPPP